MPGSPERNDMHNPEQKPVSGIDPARLRVNDAVDRTMNLPGDPIMFHDSRLADDDEKDEDGGDGGLMKMMLKTRASLAFEQGSDKLARPRQRNLLVLQHDDENAPSADFIIC